MEVLRELAAGAIRVRSGRLDVAKGNSAPGMLDETEPDRWHLDCVLGLSQLTDDNAPT